MTTLQRAKARQLLIDLDPYINPAARVRLSDVIGWRAEYSTADDTVEFLAAQGERSEVARLLASAERALAH